MQFSIPEQPLAAALVEFSKTANIQYIAPANLLEGLRSKTVSGTLMPGDALRQLLFGSGLTYSRQADGTFLISAIADAPQTAIKLDPITVTALKRETLLQDAPVAVSTVDGDSMADMGRTNVRDLYLLTPSVSYHGAISSAGQGMRIRGIGSGVIASGVDQSVSTIIDGVVTGPSGSGLQELWDVERVEVLRGPQGTLFGKNVSAGAINLVTREPTDSLEISARARYEFTYDTLRYDGAVSGPLSDHLTGRVAIFYLDQQKGTVENITRQSEENTKERYGLRAKLNYAKGNIGAKLNISYNKTDDACCSRTFSFIDIEAASGGTLNNVLPALERTGIVASDDNRIAISEGPLLEKDKTLHTVGEFSYKLSDGRSVKLISGYRKWEHLESNDGDNLDVDFVSFVGAERELRIFSQEIQFIAEGRDDWEYLLGAYYYHQDFPSTEFIGGGEAVTSSVGVTTVDSTVDVKNMALFSHATYHMSDTYSVFGGLRLLHEEISAVGQQQGDNWIWPTDYAVNQVSADDTDYTGVIGLQYAPDDKTRLYTSLSRGYKGHAIDNASNSIFYRAPQTVGDTVLTVDEAVLEPETALVFELGYKTTLLDERLLLSVVAFKGEVDDFQASAYDGNSNSFKLTNAGVVETQGLELDIQWLPWADARLFGSLAWVDASFKEFNGAPCRVDQRADGSCSANTGGQDLSGERVNENPEWQTFISFEQEWFIEPGIVSFNINYAWRDDVVYDSDLDPNTQQDAYGVLSARIGFKSYNNLGIAFFVNNLTDEDYAVRIIDAPIWRGAYQRYPGELRTYGVELSYLFE